VGINDPSWWLACPALKKKSPLIVPKRVRDIESQEVKDNNDFCLPATTEAPADVFFVHGTMIGTSNTEGNADYRDRFERNFKLRDYILWQAAAFNVRCQIYAPTYRFSTFANIGNFKERFALAYDDVKAAFFAFRKFNEERPFILAGHSQGAIHILRLLKEVDMDASFLGAVCPGAPCNESIPHTALWNCALLECKADQTMIGKAVVRRSGNNILSHTLDISQGKNCLPILGFDSTAHGIPTLFLNGYASRFVDECGLLKFVPDTPSQSNFLQFFASPNLDCHTFDFYLCWIDVRSHIASLVDEHFSSSIPNSSLSSS